MYDVWWYMLNVSTGKTGKTKCFIAHLETAVICNNKKPKFTNRLTLTKQ